MHEMSEVPAIPSMPAPPKPPPVVQVAVPVPLRRVFDYRLGDVPPAALPVGARVKVPFGKRSALGVVVSHNPPDSARALKDVAEVLDDAPVFGAALRDLLFWAAAYYHHPLGEVLQAALPVVLRKGAALDDPTRVRVIRAVPGLAIADVRAQCSRAPVQLKIYQSLAARDGDGWLELAELKQQFPNATDALKKLEGKGLIEITLHSPPPPTQSSSNSDAPKLNPQQRAAADAIAAGKNYASFLLHGITGSGKTEVYLEAAQRVIANGKQVLLLVPEIALTPQLVTRVRARLGDGVCVLHSALSDRERYRAWWRARAGDALAVLGTRSAVFTPMKSLGLIVVDEEHDISYKQQDGFRYHARDLAIKRASLEKVPVVLGSATPSMETHHNAAAGKHQLLQLQKRTGSAQLPHIGFINLQQNRPVDGMSMPLLHAVKKRLDDGEQSIIFLNRRGFAPVAQCQACGLQVACERCDARLTYHSDSERFRCHHCGRNIAADLECAECGERIFLAGAGTQRLEKFLSKKFPDARISRLDRDRITSQQKLEAELEAIRKGETDIIIGTQLIAKGHDFAKVTLVGVVNADYGLYSADFRAPEYLFQQLIQVSGRAGRDRAAGEVLIQTAHPENHTLQFLREHNFAKFAEFCLSERRATTQPPFSHIALWRAESTQKNAALQFLRRTQDAGLKITRASNHFARVEIMDAVVSPMEKLAGRYRAQLLVRSDHRGQLHQLLQQWIAAVEADPQSRRARWSVDIDPMEMF